MAVGHVQQFQILTPQEHLANALKLRADQLEIDSRTAETAAKLRQDAETQKRQAWLQTAAQTYRHEDGSPDWASITKAAQTYDPAFGLELSDRVGKAQAQEADLHTKELKNNLDSYGMVATLGEHVNDQDSYDRFLKASAQIDPTFQGPPQYDPAFMQQVVEKGYLNADYMKRHLELEKQASEGLIGADKYLGGVLSLAQSQDDVDQAFKGAATRYHLTADQVAGLKQEIGGQFGPGYASHQQQRALTPEQRQASADRSTDDTRQAATAAETARHNLAMESAERQRIAQANTAATPSAPIKEGTPDFKVAQDLAYGRMTPSFFRTLQAYNRDAGKKAALYAKAAELNPEFNEADFERGFKFISSTKIGQQLASLDNAQAGLPDLLKASDAAIRSGSPTLNAYAVRPFQTAIGNKKYSNFKTAVTAFADELSGALGYGSATDMSREMGFNMTNLDESPANFKSNMQDIVLPFVERKRASILKQGSVYGKPENNSSLTAPAGTKMSAEDLIKKYGGK